MAFPGVSKRYFPQWTPHVLFCQNTHKTGNNALEKSQVFHHIARFERFRDLNLVKYAYSVIQNWERMLYNYIRRCLFFAAVMVEGDESSRLRMAN